MFSTGTGDMFHNYLTWSVSNLVPVEIFIGDIKDCSGRHFLLEILRIVPVEIFIGDIKDCSG